MHPDFPLFQQGNKAKPDGLRWCKKVRGKLHYFGKCVDDPKGVAALKLWLDQKDDLIAGRKPRQKESGGVTVRDLCNRFLNVKLQQKEAGEIRNQSWLDYKRTCDLVIAKFGATRVVSDLASDDFEALRAKLAKTRGPVALGNEIQRVRVLFKYGYDAGIIANPMRYGPTFKRPGKKVVRLARAEKGPKMFEPADLLRLIAEADVQLKAMIYLGINCGFGNSDVGTLPLKAVDLDSGWLVYHRPKTGIDRRCALWPETVTALKEAIAKRPKAKTKDAEPLLFVTKYGASWAKASFDNPVTKEFRKLLDKLELHRPGLGFYTLRHVFRTIADESRDQPAVNAIMGHADGSMAAVYRERIADDRLKAVADYVRGWLYPATKTPADKNQPDQPAESASAA